tara:strand:- start:44 stop:310 length:267 start_codon:yes stop_codon:yes gene_type:complete
MLLKTGVSITKSKKQIMSNPTEIALQIVKDENEVNKKNLFRVMKENEKLKAEIRELKAEIEVVRGASDAYLDLLAGENGLIDKLTAQE